MKTAIALAITVAAIAGTISAHAQTYQWKDKNGQTVVSDTPPQGAGKMSRMIGGAVPATDKMDDEKPANTTKSTAEKEFEFKKRQQEAKDKADKDAKEQAAATEKKENCERARRNLAALESNQAMSTLDENGERKLMDNTAREQEMARARQMMADSCK